MITAPVPASLEELTARFYRWGFHPDTAVFLALSVRARECPMPTVEQLNAVAGLPAEAAAVVLFGERVTDTLGSTDLRALHALLRRVPSRTATVEVTTDIDLTTGVGQWSAVTCLPDGLTLHLSDAMPSATFAELEGEAVLSSLSHIDGVDTVVVFGGETWHHVYVCDPDRLTVDHPLESATTEHPADVSFTDAETTAAYWERVL